jgi:CheY-like chemotaxis protein
MAECAFMSPHGEGGANGGDRGGGLDGLRVLVVEDEFFIAQDIREAIEDAGGVVVGPVPTLAGAFAAADRGGFDLAVVDINLRGQHSYSLAEMLQSRGTPFVFATGYSVGAIPERWRRVPRWEKPYVLADLVRGLSMLPLR